jgi:phage terminase large subunit GpA-like protein
MTAKRKRNDTESLFRDIARIVAPPPKLTVSEWADLYRRLSSESSAEPGQWRTDRAPYQREIMDAINDPEVDTIVIMSSAQVGKTEILLNAIGYFIDYDPSPILVIQPTVEMAKTFSKDRLAPMLRDTPSLRGKVADARSRDSGNTVLHKWPYYHGWCEFSIGLSKPSNSYSFG